MAATSRAVMALSVMLVLLLPPSPGDQTDPAAQNPEDLMAPSSFQQSREGGRPDLFADRHDTDGDRVDDRLEEMAAAGPTYTGPGEESGSCHAFICYDRDVRPRDVTTLRALGARVSGVADAIDAVCCDSLPLDRLSAVAALPGVAMVEYAPPLTISMQVSVPATRAAPSEAYTPYSARELGVTGEGIVVAVIDTGVDDTVHESLKGAFVAGADFTGATTLNNTNPDDANGHGTHCAGLVLGRGDGGGEREGAAPGASLIDLRIADEYGESWSTRLVSALQWCMDNREAYGIRVASVSMGTSHTSDGTDALCRQVNEASAAGIVVVTSMGNDGEDKVPSPAAADSAIAVGAVDDGDTVDRRDDALAGFSNNGPRSTDRDGEEWDELKPDVCAPGVDVDGPRHDHPDGYTPYSGTSTATPHVAGVVALMLEAGPDLAAADVQGILRSTSQDRGSGRGDHDAPNYDPGYGHGIVDAYSAVSRVLDLGRPDITGPERIDASDTAVLSCTARLTRTELTSGEDTIRLTISGPPGWSEPAVVQVDTGVKEEDGLEAEWKVEAAHTDDSTGWWIMGVHISYSGEAVNPVTLEPEVTFRTQAPSSGGDNAAFRLEVDLNGVASGPSHHVINDDGSWSNTDLCLRDEDVETAATLPETYEDVPVTAVVSNAGTFDARNVVVRFTDGPPETGIEFGLVTIPRVPAGGRETAQAVWTATPGTHRLWVEADPDDKLGETDESNNTAGVNVTVVPSGAGGGLPRSQVNTPPVGVLEVAPEEPVERRPVTLNASASRDTDGGAVVLYYFDFGDGTNTGWVTDSIVEHIYGVPGTYVAAMVARDNGGGRSQPVRRVLNVSFAECGSVDLYPLGEDGLSGQLPMGPERNSTHIPCGRADNVIALMEVGVWEGGGDAVDHTMLTTGPAEFWAYVLNGNDDDDAFLSLEFRLSVNGGVQAEAVTEVTRVEAGHMEILTAGTTQFYDELCCGDTISLLISACTGTDGLILLWGSTDVPTGFGFDFAYAPGSPPVADAGADMTAYAGENVTLSGSGNDTDGDIVMYAWDLDGDGTTDQQSPDSGTAEHVYDVPGMYGAALTVYDDDGLSGTDTANVSVTYRPENLRPVVDIDHPSDNSTVQGTVIVSGGASDDGGPGSVEVRFGGGGWKEADREDDEGPSHNWTYEWDTFGLPKGYVLVEARAFDGELYSDVASITVYVDNPGGPPRISALTWEAEPVDGAMRHDILLTARVEDPDGPDDVWEVTANLGDLGLEEEGAMMDDGRRGDETAGDGIWSLSVTALTEDLYGGAEAEVTAVDIDGGTDRARTAITVPGSPPAIGRMTLEETGVSPEGAEIILMEVVVADPDGPANIASVRADLSALGLDDDMSFNDGGRAGDREAEDGTFSLEFHLGADALGDGADAVVTATDAEGHTDQDTLRVRQNGIIWMSVEDEERKEGEYQDKSAEGDEDDTPFIPIAAGIGTAVIALIARHCIRWRRRKKGASGKGRGG